MAGVSIWHLIVIVGVIAVPSIIVLAVILLQKPKP